MDPAAAGHTGAEEATDNDALERLCHACFAGDLEAIQASVEHAGGANQTLPEVDQRERQEFRLGGGGAPIHYACSSGNVACVAWLVEVADADPQLHTRNGRTPLYVACADGSKDVCELLLRLGVDVNAGSTDGATPLHIASQRGYLPIVMLLLEHGADVNIFPEKRWHSALSVSLYQKHYVIAKALLAHSATWEHVGKQDCLLIVCEENEPEFLRLLLDNGADPASTRFHNNMTPLHAAVGYGRLGAVRILLEEYGLSADRVNAATQEEGETPLSIAVRGYQDSIAELLLRHGAAGSLTSRVRPTEAEGARMSLEIRATGLTPMERALQSGNQHMCRLLAVYGGRNAQVNYSQLGVPHAHPVAMWWRRTGKFCALQFALQTGSEALVKKLLFLGADPDLWVQGTPTIPSLAISAGPTIAALMSDALGPWRPVNHSLFGPAFARGVWLTMLMWQRLANTTAGEHPLSLPVELREHVLRQCRRVTFLDVDPDSNTSEEQAGRSIDARRRVAITASRLADLDLFD